jgi:hypothetical protein
MNDFEKLAEISRLLDEAYKHYFSYEGHCKSSEGYMHVEYGNYWDRSDNPTELKVKSVHIYSYVFCRQGRSEDFNSIDEALDAVRGWHADEMAYDPNTPEAIENNRLMDEMASEFISKMMEEGRLTVINVDKEEETPNA